MDRLFKELGEEHRLIASVLDAFDAFLTSVEQGQAKDPVDLFQFIVFLTDYVDDIHHQKEERILMKAMAKHGFSLVTGPLAHVKEQHERERCLFAALHRVVVGRGALADAIPAARELIAFERRHMEKEGELLYPAAREELGKDDPTPMLAALDRFNQRRDRDGHAAWLVSLGTELVSRYGPART